MKFILLLCFFPVMLVAQDLNETFDGPLLPTNWDGTLGVFTIDDGELHLDDPAPESSNFSYLSGAFGTNGETVWTIYLRQELSNPSTSNNSRWYLQSDNPDLSGDLNGYFVQIGGVGSGTADDVSLYRQDVSSTSGDELIDGIDSTALNADFNLRVSRSAAGEWTLEREEAGSWIVEGMAVDNSYPSGLFAGVLCEYTSTNGDAFYFDNFTIDPIFQDTEAPSISSPVVTGANELCITLSENLDQASSAPGNFSVPGIGAAVSATPSTENPLILCLQFASDFVGGTNYELEYGNIADLAGNETLAGSIPFSFVTASPGDVIINEILAHPDTDLPATVQVEFVELYNPTVDEISMAGWTFSDANEGLESIPATSIAGGQYILLCKAEDAAALSGFGTVVGMDSWPSLNKSDDVLSLRDQAGNLMDQVAYESSWYGDTEKADGGWSLERINTDNTCNTGDNWTACVAVEQTTPAALNSVEGLFDDETAPNLSNLGLQLPNQVYLEFSEAIDPLVLLDAGNYSIDQGIGNAVDVSSEESGILISFANDFEQGIFYNIDLQNLLDCSGNALELTSFEFAVPEPAEKFDILINEIYADVTIPEEFETAQMDLPSSEYIELFNRSDKAISLQDYKLRDAVDTTDLGNYLLLPGQYVVLCSDANVSKFTNDGIPVLGVSGFPTLNDTEDDLELYRDDWLSMHAATYDRSIFESEFKEEGGWSYELIDPNNPCSGEENWAESTDFRGGTPGTINSVNGTNADTTAAVLLRAEAVDANTIYLFFNENIDNGSPISVGNYSMNGFSINAASFINGGTIQLDISPEMQAGQVYEISVSGQEDCVGNASGNITREVGLSELFESGDAVINEILFNPPTDGVDYVELYNRSNKVLDLSEWFVANDPDPDDEIDEIGNLKVITLDQYSFYPGQYVILASDATAVRSIFADCRDLAAINIIEVSLPTYRTDAGTVAITDLTGTVFLDRVSYDEDWHFQLLDEDKGVSIERISPEGVSDDPDNWQSASFSSCFGTPGEENSQFFGNELMFDDIISVEPEVFSPDSDGFQDFALINYEFADPGFTANASIYDSRGRRIVDIAKNEIVGATGSWKWDGIDSDGGQAPIGIYVVHLKAFNLEGDIIESKQTVVLAKQLD